MTHTRLILLALALLVGCGGDDAPVVRSADPATRIDTDLGTAEGYVDDVGAHVWLGLPYAAPPVGDLRWRAPRPPEGWNGVRDATAFGDVCPQIGSPLGGAPEAVYGQFWGKEDCLFLNVYAPAERGDDLPVLVWIHGGGNTIGHSGFYDGAPLAAAHDVVVVTLNYRLGPLGWFRHPGLAGDDAADASGNYGTLDLIAALEWTRDHIAAFGGNPDRVVVFGESAGATNISSLLVSPYAAGLFHGAILQSGGTGSASAARATNYVDDDEAGDVLSASEMLLKAIKRDRADCDRACARAEADALSPADQGALLRDLDALAVFELYSDGMDLLGPNSPTVIRDGAVLPSEPFLDQMGVPGRYNAVPTIVGTNRDEPKIFMAFDPDAVKRFAGLPLWPHDERMYDLHGEYGALAWRIRGVDDIARRLAGADVPVWAYRWDWDEEGSFAFIDLTQLLGAAHGLEIPFVFGHFDLGPQTPLLFNDDNAEGRVALSARMMAYWAAFARDLDPGTGADDGGPRWAPWNPAGEQTYVRLDTGPNGIAMANDEIDIAGFAERIAEDTRFESAEERCEVFVASVRWDDRPDLAAAAERLDCTLPKRS